jgi:hypothetical protein
MAGRALGWRALMGWARMGPSLAVLASALSGCATRMVGAALGPPLPAPTDEVVREEWAGRHAGDEGVVVYAVWRAAQWQPTPA